MANNKLPLLIICASVLLVIASGGVYAWDYIVPIATNKATTGTNYIDAKLEFAFDDSIKGVPGEIIPVSTVNRITKPAKSDDIVCKIVYRVSGNSRDIIEGIELRGGDASGLILDPNSTATELTYYVKLSGVAEKDLGELCVEYKLRGNEVSAQAYNLEAELFACQKSETAIYEILGIQPTGRYASLLN